MSVHSVKRAYIYQATAQTLLCRRTSPKI